MEGELGHAEDPQSDQASLVYRYAKLAYFIIDKSGTVKFVKVMDNPLDSWTPPKC